jgi:hypothetical protein
MLLLRSPEAALFAHKAVLYYAVAWALRLTAVVPSWAVAP